MGLGGCVRVSGDLSFDCDGRLVAAIRCGTGSVVMAGTGPGHDGVTLRDRLIRCENSLPRSGRDPVSVTFRMPRAPRITPEDRRATRCRPAGRRPPAPPQRIPAPAVPPRIETPRRPRFRLLRYAIIAAIWGALAAGALLLWFARDLPRPEAALDASRRPSLTLEDRTGHVFATLRRRRRRAAAPGRHAGLPAGRRGGGRGPAVLASPRHRPDRPGARRIDRPGRAATWCRAAPPSPSRWRRTCS